MGCYIDNGDGTVDDHIKQDINDLRVSGTRLGGDETENRKRATMKMTITTMTDNKVKEMIAMVQECSGAMTSDQLLKAIEGNQEEDGRIKKYKDEGAGLCGMVKGEGAGLDGTVNGAGTERDCKLLRLVCKRINFSVTYYKGSEMVDKCTLLINHF